MHQPSFVPFKMESVTKITIFGLKMMVKGGLGPLYKSNS